MLRVLYLVFADPQGVAYSIEQALVEFFSALVLPDIKKPSDEWWCTPLVPAVRKQRQADLLSLRPACYSE